MTLIGFRIYCYIFQVTKNVDLICFFFTLSFKHRHLVRRVGGWDVSMPFPRYTLSTYHKDDILSAIIPASRVDKYLWQIASQNIHCLHARNRLQIKVKSADGVGRQINVLI